MMQKVAIRLRVRGWASPFCQPSNEWVPFFELGKAKAAKGGGWVRLSPAMPKIQWDSNPHCPYGY